MAHSSPVTQYIGHGVSCTQSEGCANLELLPQQVLSYWKRMPGIRDSPEFPLLFAAYAQLFPDTLDPANAHLDAVLCQIAR